MTTTFLTSAANASVYSLALASAFLYSSVHASASSCALASAFFNSAAKAEVSSWVFSSADLTIGAKASVVLVTRSFATAVALETVDETVSVDGVTVFSAFSAAALVAVAIGHSFNVVQAPASPAPSLARLADMQLTG